MEFLQIATASRFITNCDGQLLQIATAFLLQIATGITKGDDLILQIATVQSRLYLSNATLWPYKLSHVKNEFSLVGLTACQYENG